MGVGAINMLRPTSTRLAAFAKLKARRAAEAAAKAGVPASVAATSTGAAGPEPPASDTSKLTPLAFFDRYTFQPRKTVALNVHNTFDALQKSLPTGTRLLRGRLPASGAGTMRRAAEYLAVTPDYKVAAKVFLPVCMPPPSQLPVEGLPLDDYTAHVEGLRNSDGRIFFCVCRAEAAGFAFIDAFGNIVDDSAARSFVAQTKARIGSLQSPGTLGSEPEAAVAGREHRVMPKRQDGDATLVTARRSYKSSFYSDINAYLDRYEPQIEAAAALFVRDQHGLFTLLSRSRKNHVELMNPDAEDERDDGDDDLGRKMDTPKDITAGPKTVFSDPRWADVSVKLMANMDVAVHRHPDVNVTSAAGSTRHGLLELV